MTTTQRHPAKTAQLALNELTGSAQPPTIRINRAVAYLVALIKELAPNCELCLDTGKIEVMTYDGSRRTIDCPKHPQEKSPARVEIREAHEQADIAVQANELITKERDHALDVAGDLCRALNCTPMDTLAQRLTQVDNGITGLINRGLKNEDQGCQELTDIINKPYRRPPVYDQQKVGIEHYRTSAFRTRMVNIAVTLPDGTREGLDCRVSELPDQIARHIWSSHCQAHELEFRENQVHALKDLVNRVIGQLNRLHGQPFSARNYHALKERAETAEAKLDKIIAMEKIEPSPHYGHDAYYAFQNGVSACA